MAFIAAGAKILVQYKSSRLAQLFAIQGLVWARTKFGGHAAEHSSAVAEMDRSAHTAALRAQLLHAQARIKKKVDHNRTEREFVVGDQVLLKLRPYAQSTVANHSCAK
jgi:hypothetical protein